MLLHDSPVALMKLFILLLPQINSMKQLFFFILLFSFQLLQAQEYPGGYAKQFEAGFTKAKLSEQYAYTNGTKSTFSKGVVHLNYQPDSNQAFIPNGIMLIDNLVLGDFVANTKVMFKTIELDTLGGFFIVSGLRDSSNYYFIQLNNLGANFYKMYKGEVSLIDSDSSFVLSEQVWLDLKVSRDISKRTISIAYKGQNVEFYDPNLVMGYLGFGITKAKLSVKAIDIWAPTSIAKPTLVFKQPVEKTEP